MFNSVSISKSLTMPLIMSFLCSLSNSLGSWMACILIQALCASAASAPVFGTWPHKGLLVFTSYMTDPHSKVINLKAFSQKESNMLSQSHFKQPNQSLERMEVMQSPPLIHPKDLLQSMCLSFFFRTALQVYIKWWTKHKSFLKKAFGLFFFFFVKFKSFP